MTRIVHLSDLHFPKVQHRAVETLLDDVHQWSPDLVAISGDFVQSGSAAEFRLARRFLDQIRRPWLAVPGNHDIPSRNLWLRLVQPFKRYRRYIASDLAPLFEAEEVVVAGVNTARPFGLYWDWSRGRISYNQMEAIRDKLSSTDESIVRVVVTHHPFLLNADTLQRRLVGRSRQALSVFRQARVDLLLAGHLHRTIIGTVGEIREGSDRPSPMVVAQAATALSTRLKQEEINAYYRIHLAPGEICIEPRRWTGDSTFISGNPWCYQKMQDIWRSVAA